MINKAYKNYVVDFTQMKFKDRSRFTGVNGRLRNDIVKMSDLVDECMVASSKLNDVMLSKKTSGDIKFIGRKITSLNSVYFYLVIGIDSIPYEYKRTGKLPDITLWLYEVDSKGKKLKVK